MGAKDLVDIAVEIRDILAGKPDIGATKVIALPKGDIKVPGSEPIVTTEFRSVTRIDSALQLCKIRVTTPKACFIRLVIDDKDAEEDIDEYISTDDGLLIDWFPYGEAYKATKSVEILAKAKTANSTVSGTIVGESIMKVGT